ncbi:hypothetical protein Glove_27g10 [Diversispora epigaea]|uniref:Uncharacterized protein n=1 Tax=Diversispora epigaea TaxID=1348612 RepID=A0A397JIZ2_9GLOM|nr:hypothetical protein Glove_27g10 [Diversispora epigaea]
MFKSISRPDGIRNMLIPQLFHIKQSFSKVEEKVNLVKSTIIELKVIRHTEEKGIVRTTGVGTFCFFVGAVSGQGSLARNSENDLLKIQQKLQ